MAQSRAHLWTLVAEATTRVLMTMTSPRMDAEDTIKRPHKTQRTSSGRLDPLRLASFYFLAS